MGSNEEADDAEVFGWLMDIIRSAKQGMYFVDQDRMSVVEAAYELCKIAMPGAKVTLKKHDPLPSTSYIRVDATDFHCEKPKLLAMALSAATKVEFWPLVDGTISMDVTFYGVAKAMG